MPLTRIAAPRHLPDALVKALAAAVQDALVRTCQVPPNDLFQLIQRFDTGDMVMDESFGGVWRSDGACIVEITFLQGRTDTQKRELFRHIAAGAVVAGVRADDVMVALTENGPGDWSLGRGRSYADHTEHG
ncbi:tautomerase family protein [Ideonella sp.]|uniref:tautomerase family protein n=1 Tax=Ideonella sp. TaxID=1929293 RepID=UPI0035B35A24